MTSDGMKVKWWAVFFIVWCCPANAFSSGYSVRHSDQVIVMGDPRMPPSVQPVVDAYGRSLEILQFRFGWDYQKRPRILLVPSHDQFIRISGSAHILAFAIPRDRFISMDYSRISGDPGLLQSVMTHELCHLYLHDHLGSIPRWLDEGICQWVSGGWHEMLTTQGSSQLNSAAMWNQFIPFAALTYRFPDNPKAMRLAYEQSHGFVIWLVHGFGSETFLQMLTSIKNGASVTSAFRTSFGQDITDLEATWKQSLKPGIAWMTFIVHHIYEILFFLAGLATILGFIRRRQQRRHRWDWEDDEGPG